MTPRVAETRPIKFPCPVSCYGQTWHANSPQELHDMIEGLVRGVLPLRASKEFERWKTRYAGRLTR